MKIQTNEGRDVIVNGFPDECPHCHKSISPTALYGYKFNSRLEVLLVCPSHSCRKTFIGYYYVSGGTIEGIYQNKTSQGTLIGKEFSGKINEISLSFVNIYNQAMIAEQQDLLEICGVGYRKALEFLIKDYTILNYALEKENIEKMLLGQVIVKYVRDLRIITVARRAVWLGNDETHYIRKWEGKNLEDLKKLIELTVHWIEMEILTSSFEAEMPE